VQPAGASFIRMTGLRALVVLWATFAIGIVLQIGEATAQSKHVLLLHSFGSDFRPWRDYAAAIKAEVERQSRWSLDIQDYPIVTARSANDNPEVPFADYLRLLYAGKPPDLIITIGGPAAEFVQRRRTQLGATTPLLLAAVDQRYVEQAALTTNDAAVAVNIQIPPLFDNILQLLPATKTVLVMIGGTPSEKFWQREIQRGAQSFEDRIRFVYSSDQSFDEMLRLAAAPPPKSVIFWPQLRVDAAGTVHEGDQSLKKMYSVTQVPIFSYDDTFFTGETVGGPMLSMSDIARQTGSTAVRMLAGESAGEIKTTPIGFSAPRYDWRQLQRWSIDESRLPPGSSILFREEPPWQRYRWSIAVVLTALFLQTGLITGLLYERRLRQAAEAEAQLRMAELAHMNRQATAGELSASITHELNQPLAAILANAEAAELLLNAQSPDLKEIRHIISDILRDDQRASSVINRMRSLLKKRPFERLPVDLNEIATDVLDILAVPARTHRIEFIRSLTTAPVKVRGDAIQLQQVLMNLIVNAMDAVAEVADAPREIVVGTALAGANSEISVSDTGPGFPHDHCDKIFVPFFTTKQRGMGVGLSIVQTIVKAHGGRVVAENRPGGVGAIFRVFLPLAP
jgi:signal transduction histidine kinase